MAVGKTCKMRVKAPPSCGPELPAGQASTHRYRSVLI